MALAFGTAAQAQVSRSEHPQPDVISAPLGASVAQAPDVPPTLREVRRLKPGMLVLDRHGAKVGVIIRTNQVRNGRPAVRLDVNGAQFTVRTSTLHLTRVAEEAVTSLTRSQVRNSAILNAD